MKLDLEILEICLLQTLLESAITLNEKQGFSSIAEIYKKLNNKIKEQTHIE